MEKDKGKGKGSTLFASNDPVTCDENWFIRENDIVAVENTWSLKNWIDMILKRQLLLKTFREPWTLFQQA